MHCLPDWNNELLWIGQEWCRLSFQICRPKIAHKFLSVNVFVLVLIVLKNSSHLVIHSEVKTVSNFAHFPVPPFVTFSLTFKWLTSLNCPNPLLLAGVIVLVGYLMLKWKVLYQPSVLLRWMTSVGYLPCLLPLSSTFLKVTKPVTFDGLWLDNGWNMKFLYQILSSFDKLCF